MQQSISALMTKNNVRKDILDTWTQRVAEGKVNDRMSVNIFFQSLIINSSLDTKGCLIHDGTNEAWYNLFEENIVPALTEL